MEWTTWPNNYQGEHGVAPYEGSAYPIKREESGEALLKPIPRKLSLDLMPTEGEFALAVVGARAERSLASVLVIASVNVSRGIPAKPNHPHEDIGASFYYLIGRIAPRSA